MSEPYSTTSTEQLRVIRDGLARDLQDAAYAEDHADIRARMTRICAEIDRRTTITLPQRHCRDQADHPAHNQPTFVPGAGDNLHMAEYRCPGRYTPSQHRAPHPSPVAPSDPFAGIDEDTEFDATRPGVS